MMTAQWHQTIHFMDNDKEMPLAEFGGRKGNAKASEELYLFSGAIEMAQGLIMIQ